MAKHGWGRVPLIDGTSEPGSYPPMRPIFKWIVGAVVIGAWVYVLFFSK